MAPKDRPSQALPLADSQLALGLDINRAPADGSATSVRDDSAPGARESGPSEGPLLGQAEPTGPMEPTAQRGPDRASGRSSRSWPCRPAAVTEVSGARSPGRCGPGSGPTGRGVLHRRPAQSSPGPRISTLDEEIDVGTATDEPARAGAVPIMAGCGTAGAHGRAVGRGRHHWHHGRAVGRGRHHGGHGRAVGRGGRPGRGSEGRNFPVRRTEGSDIAASSGLSSHTEVHRPAHVGTCSIVGHSSGYTRGSSVFKSKTSQWAFRPLAIWRMCSIEWPIASDAQFKYRINRSPVLRSLQSIGTLVITRALFSIPSTAALVWRAQRSCGYSSSNRPMSRKTNRDPDPVGRTHGEVPSTRARP